VLFQINYYYYIINNPTLIKLPHIFYTYLKADDIFLICQLASILKVIYSPGNMSVFYLCALPFFFKKNCMHVSYREGNSLSMHKWVKFINFEHIKHTYMFHYVLCIKDGLNIIRIIFWLFINSKHFLSDCCAA